MFLKLNKKYRRLLLTSVTFVSVCYSLAVFFFYCITLKDDYQSKLAYYNKQQVANVEKSLWRAEFSMNALLSRIDTDMTGTFSQFEIRNELKKITDFNLDISSAFMVSSEYPNLIAGENYALANYLLQTAPPLFDGSSQDIQWYYLQYESTFDNMLLCAKSIASPSGGEAYTFCLTIPESSVLPIVTAEADNNSVFAKGNFSFSVIADADSIICMNSDKSSVATEINAAGAKAYSTRISSTPFTLLMQASESPLNDMLLLFFVGIVILCAALLCTAYFVLKVFLKRLTFALESLSGQFSSFFETMDR